MDKKNLTNVVVFFILLLLWVSLFSIGSIVDAGKYVPLINDSEASISTKILSFFGFLTTWTWSNILGLCCVASMLGEYGRISMNKRLKINLMAALVRGFFIFLFLTAGQLLITGTLPLPKEVFDAAASELQTTNRGSYRRIGGICSLFGFIVGYHPDFFKSMLDKLLKTEDQNGGG